MNDQVILIIEDSDDQRIALHEALKMRGFSVESAGTVKEAKERIKELGERLAIVVLDMRLEDASAPAITGADIGLELSQQQPRRLPEFLILSAWSLTDYYKLAIRLGVAAYLSKEETDTYLFIRHIRALMIKRNLSVESSDISQKIGRIAETSQGLSEAVNRFCQEIISPVFSEFLGAPYILLIHDGRHIDICSSEKELLDENRSTYKELDKLLHNKPNNGLFVIDGNILEGLKSDIPFSNTTRLAGAVFLPFPISRDIRLSLCILKGAQPLSEDPVHLAEVLNQYLHRAVMEPLLCTLKQHIELKSKREAELIAQACLSIAQEQLAALSSAAVFEEASPSPYIRALTFSIEDLRDTGQILMLLERDNSLRRPEAVTITDLIHAAQNELEPMLPEEKIHIDGNCVVEAFRDDLSIAITRILQWFVRRAIDIPESLSINVKCREIDDEAEIVFDDCSNRLNSLLRRRLFFPFAESTSLPTADGEFEISGRHLLLYLAKALVEVKHGGTFEDRSDELPDKVGHRFVIRLPSSSRLAC